MADLLKPNNGAGLAQENMKRAPLLKVELKAERITLVKSLFYADLSNFVPIFFLPKF